MSGEEDLRVGVVGVGHLGQHHARIYSAMEGCRLTWVADLDGERARSIASASGAESTHDYRALEGRVDAVSVAVPTESHAEVASFFLDRGVSVLVEKPMAPAIAEADALIESAKASGAILGVGHTERFNPAVEALAARSRDPRFIESHRLGSFAPRSLDIDVVLDLMIHDIDIALRLVGTGVRKLEAVGVAALTDRVDIANARLEFDTGCVANLTASRVSAARTRKVRVFQHDSYLSCDCGDRSLEHFMLDRSDPAARPRIVRDTVEIPEDEPLRRELAAFVGAVRGGPAFPVDGTAGRAALEVALSVIDAIDRGRAGARS